MAGYALAPGSFDIVGFSCLAAGTSLCSGAANSFNQVGKHLSLQFVITNF